MLLKRHPVLLAIASALLTLLATIVVLNVTPGEKRIEQRLTRLYDTADPQFSRSLGALLGPPLADGNRVDTLVNGERIFPAMLEAIRSARQSISFETYIYWSGTIGREFAEALIERRRAGVPVHVLLDWVGSVKMDQALLQQMSDAGVAVRRFHKPRWSDLSHLNNRTHRKLLIVDGRIGFTGGVGIADVWRGDAQDPEHWRDTHFRVVGPAVAQMQAVFLDNWVKATGEVLHGDRYFPALPSEGPMAAQMFSSSPTAGSESMHLMYLLAITAASRSIELESSYFVPDEMAVEALVAAARRGVRIRVITPGPLIDTEVVRRASRGRWGPLLQAGIEIAEYQPTMFHCKVLVVDGLLVSVGSTNFDNRSFRLNDEANLNVLDRQFAARQIEVFEADLRRSRRITFEEWQRRPWHEKLVERLASWLGPQL